jgi:hypothetical protein
MYWVFDEETSFYQPNQCSTQVLVMDTSELSVTLTIEQIKYFNECVPRHVPV